jgi:hypothetical protein
MRKINIRNTEIERIKKSLRELIVYNKGRNEYTKGGFGYPIFEHWFDEKDKLDVDYLFDCANGRFRHNWNEFGNFSKARNFRDFLNIESDLPFMDLPNSQQPVTLDDHLNYLGSYRRMNSKGLVSLNADNLQVFFWSIIFELACKQRYIFTKEKIEELTMLCIEKTLYHELFHHFTDANSYVVNGFKYDYCTEEAMAVACSRLLIGFESKSNQAYVSDFYELAYSYNSRGYRDWINFKSDEQFILNLISYMRIDNNLSRMGQELLPLAEAMLYAIMENPNVNCKVVLC